MVGQFFPSTPYCPYGVLDQAINYRILYSFAITPAQELLAWVNVKRAGRKSGASTETVEAASLRVRRLRDAP